MHLVRYLQHWLSGTGARLPVTYFVPFMHPIRQWADTFPWTALVSAIEQRFAQRFPNKSPRSRRPVPIRVLFALELLKHELGASDEEICHRVRTDFAVMYACGLRRHGRLSRAAAGCQATATACLHAASFRISGSLNMGSHTHGSCVPLASLACASTAGTSDDMRYNGHRVAERPAAWV